MGSRIQLHKETQKIVVTEKQRGITCMHDCTYEKIVEQFV